MSTTDPKIPMAILDCMAALSIDFAVLHDETRVASGCAVSDVDIVTAMAPKEILTVLRACIERHGLHPILTWRYDVDSASVFFTNDTGTEGAQLDLIYGDSGFGNYGLYPAAILSNAVSGDRWPKASEMHELLYSIRKRHVKRQFESLRDLLTRTNELPLSYAKEASDEIFSPDASHATVELISGMDPKTRSPGRHRWAWPHFARLVERTRHPAGLWVAVEGHNAAEVAKEVSQRFGEFLPRSGHGALDGSSGGSLKTLKSLASVRWRAGVYVTHGRAPRMANPDLKVRADGKSLEEIMSMIIDTMQARVQA